jgi:hypothetical protein
MPPQSKRSPRPVLRNPLNSSLLAAAVTGLGTWEPLPRTVFPSAELGEMRSSATKIERDNDHFVRVRRVLSGHVAGGKALHTAQPFDFVIAAIRLGASETLAALLLCPAQRALEKVQGSSNFPKCHGVYKRSGRIPRIDPCHRPTAPVLVGQGLEIAPPAAVLSCGTMPGPRLSGLKP